MGSVKEPRELVTCVYDVPTVVSDWWNQIYKLVSYSLKFFVSINTLQMNMLDHNKVKRPVPYHMGVTLLLNDRSPSIEGSH